MSEQDLRAGGTVAPGQSAGALLRQSREAAGLSVDDAAHQLKLAPRQVRALEEGDFASLPGRTFVRGFVRNYARLLHLDPDTVLHALPETAAGPALEAPTLHPTAPSIGELPTTETNRPGWTRWAIPLSLAAIVAAAAIYEFLRPATESRHPTSAESAAVTAPVSGTGANGPASDAPSATPLPNPVASAVAPNAETPAPVPSTPAAAMAPHAPSAVAPAPPPTTGSTASSVAKAPATATARTTTAPAAPAGVTAADAANAEATLALAFRDYSWVEVKDRNGRVLLSRMNAGGTSETVAGVPPFDVVIGNANDVRVTFRGKPVDLTPYTRQNIAKMVLQ